MPDLYLNPTYWAYDHVVIDGDATTEGDYPAIVYFPADYGVDPISILAGKHPLVVFSHGMRSNSAAAWLCPEDISTDYLRWEAILALLARCGFVVVSHDVRAVIDNMAGAVARIETTLAWMRGSWRFAESLRLSPTFESDGLHPMAMAPLVTIGGSHAETARQSGSTDSTATLVERVLEGAVIGFPTATALAGHSWGGRASIIAGVDTSPQINAIASISYEWENASLLAPLAQSGIPTLTLSGNGDSTDTSAASAIWPSLQAPKHQAVMQGMRHWDWFGPGPQGLIHPCEPGVTYPNCPIAWRATGELLIGFMSRYLRGYPVPPSLIGPPGERTDIQPFFDNRSRECALKVRWDDGSGSGTGEKTFGRWTESPPW